MTIIDNKNNEIKCLIEEVDCQSTISTLRYNEPTFIYQDIPNRNGIETVDEWEIKRQMEDHSTERMPLESIINTDQEEKCVIEEIDCKQSLINIGYNGSEDKAEVGNVKPMYEFENKNSAETCKPLEDISSKNIADATAAQLPIDYSKLLDIAKYFSEFDINKFLSSSIISSVVDYTTGKNSTSKVVDENPDETKKALEEMETEEGMGTEEGMETGDEMETEEGTETGDEIETEEEMETRDSIETDTVEEIDNRNNVLHEKSNFFKKDWTKKVLHTGEIYLENKIGFLSLLSVLGLAGIFTDTRACLGFFGFLYFIRYFFLMRDESFKNSLLKASKIGFFTNITISVVTIVLWLLINKVVLFPLGLGIGMAVSVIVFTVILEVCVRKN